MSTRLKRSTQIVDETGQKKYPNLTTLAKCVLLVSHGNADPERGFSLNKHLLAIHGSSIKEETIESIRLVKDYIIRVGGIKNITVSNEMILSSRNAYHRYEAYLESQKKLREEEQKQTNSCTTENAKDDEKKKKIENINRDMRV